MTDKEFYKARAEGWDKVAEIRREVSDSDFLEFMGLVREVTSKYQPDMKYIQEEIAEKSEIRKRLIRLYK